MNSQHHPSRGQRPPSASHASAVSSRRVATCMVLFATSLCVCIMLSPAADEFFSFFGVPTEISNAERVRRQQRSLMLEQELRRYQSRGTPEDVQPVVTAPLMSGSNHQRDESMVATEAMPAEAAEPAGDDFSTEVAIPNGDPPAQPTAASAEVIGGKGFEAKLDLFPTFDYDKSITEIVAIDNRRDGVYYNVPASMAALDSIKINKKAAKEEASEALKAASAAMTDSELAHYTQHGLPFKGDSFLTTNDWRGKCFYEAHNFCVLNGTMTFFHKVSDNPNIAGGSLRMCTEFSQHSPTIRLKYETRPLPADGLLPAPLMTKTPAWILQYWCQDMFHMTLTMLPAFQTKMREFPKLLAAAGVISKSNSMEGDSDVAAAAAGSSRYIAAAGGGHDGQGAVPSWWGPSVEGGDLRGGDDAVIHPDVFIRIAKGKRKKSAYCKVKLGDPRNWEDVRNSKWGDKQFPIAGNPYWPFYQTLTPQPDRIYPLYRGATAKSACYTNGIIDKYYIKNMMGDQAREYTDALLSALNVTKGPKRQCGKYRMTLIDRRGRTRKLTNIAEIAAAATKKGFAVQAVALETLPIRKQLELITSTDVLMGMHGNGITWLQFLPPGSAVVEMVGVWYTPYALLWGHKHFHSSMRNNMAYKLGGEFKPFAHNVTEVEDLLEKVRAHLDATSCAKGGAAIDYKPPNDKLENLYKDCAPHC